MASDYRNNEDHNSRPLPSMAVNQFLLSFATRSDFTLALKSLIQ